MADKMAAGAFGRARDYGCEEPFNLIVLADELYRAKKKKN